MSDSIDQQFVEYIVKQLVANPDAVSINRTIDEKGVLLELSVEPEDLGRVIGKRGATAQSIRTLLRALGTKNEARYNLKIVDTDNGAGSRQSNRSVPSDDTSSSKDDDDKAVEEDSTESVENGPSDLEKKHREDLADLDDLDI